MEKRKLIIVAWHKCCKQLNEGGIVLRSLIILNKATNLKNCRDFLNANSGWSILLKARVLRNERPIKNNFLSSI